MLYCHIVMKKYFLILCVFIIFVFISYFLYSGAKQIVRKLASPIPSTQPIPTEILPTETPGSEFQFDKKIYQFYFHQFAKNESLELVPNFENATFSAQIMKNKSCTFGINGGFYQTNRMPLGLFQIGSKKIGAQIQSSTFNGFFSSSSGIIAITSSPIALFSPSDFIFQSGPLIFLKNQIQPNFIDEDYSRRNLIAKTVSGNYYFFSIFEKDNVFNGPRLKDLREIFLSEDLRKIADFELLLNLDGGSASTFYDKNVQVEEYKMIGSFLCGRKN